MADHYRRYVVCPFYKQNGKHYVKCEGGSYLIFPDDETEKEHLKQFCCDGWKQCSVAIFLNRYFERNEERTCVNEQKEIKKIIKESEGGSSSKSKRVSEA